MENKQLPRHIIIAAVLVMSLIWSLGSAQTNKSEYPNGEFLATPQWLNAHKTDKNLIIADVRTDEYSKGGLIPGAIRLVWSDFRTNDIENDLASVFVGVAEAQKILGRHGITRDDTIVLYDSVERDGGATASYVFWVLDMLGHQNKKILISGINGWKDAGFDLVTAPRQPKPLLYQAGSKNIQGQSLINGDFVYKRLGDQFYQIVDVRSEAEYSGKQGTRGLDGEPLKLGHIPTAVNINYTSAWADPENKELLPYDELQQIYSGLDPSKGVIVYCNSGRRSSFSYFILRLLGFKNVYTYEASWKEWGNPDYFFPVETRENKLTGKFSSQPSAGDKNNNKSNQKSAASNGKSSQPESGYISCGG